MERMRLICISCTLLDFSVGQIVCQQWTFAACHSSPAARKEISSSSSTLHAVAAEEYRNWPQHTFRKQVCLQLWYPLNSRRLTDLHVFPRSIDGCLFERNLWTPIWATLCKLNVIYQKRTNKAYPEQCAFYPEIEPCTEALVRMCKWNRIDREGNQISRHDSSHITCNKAGGQQIEILCRSHRQDIL